MTAKGIDQRDIGPRDHREPILLPYQVKWNQESAPLAVAEKGRRIGLSWSEAAEDSLLASKSPGDGGMDVWYASYNKEMTEQFVRDVAFWARIYDYVASEVEEDTEVFQDGDEQKAITVFRVRFASGHRVTGLVSHPRVLRSKQGKVVIDEAGFVDNLGDVIKAALALLIWGAVVRIISTHNGEDNEFNQLIEDIRAGKRPGAVVHRIPFMDAVEQGLYRKICRKLGREWSPEAERAFVEETYAIYGDDADEELDCIPSKGGGAYLLRTVIESCMSPEIPVLRWSPPSKDFVDWDDARRYREVEAWCEAELAPLLSGLPELHSWFGEDFGRNVDLTCIWPLQELPGLTLRTPFVLELRDCPFSQQEQILFFVVDRLPKFSGGALDAGGNGAFLAERARQRYGEDYIEQVKFHESWNVENWPPLKAAFEDRTVIVPMDSEVLDDLRAVKKVKGVPKVPRDARTESKGGGKRHGDSAVSLVLAHFAARTIEAGGEFEVVTGPPRQTRAIMAGYR